LADAKDPRVPLPLRQDLDDHHDLLLPTIRRRYDTDTATALVTRAWFAGKVDGFTDLGDPDAEFSPGKPEERRQADAVRLAESVRRMHFHRHAAGEHAGGLFSHTHADDEPGHQHPGRQAYPARADGGYWEESGPSLGSDTPPEMLPNIVRTLEFIARSPKTPDHHLMRWRLRLFCGHVVERTAHIDHKTVTAAFTGRVRCPECELDPATIVAARAVGPVATLAPAATAVAATRQADLDKRLAKARAEVARLEKELGPDR
jgi:hypothetical protein